MSLTLISDGDSGSSVRATLNGIINALQLTVSKAIAANAINMASDPNFAVIDVTNTGTLNTISNVTQLTKFMVRPNAGTILTINDGAGNIKLNAPQKVIDGNTGGYLELQLRGASLYEVGFNDQYN